METKLGTASREVGAMFMLVVEVAACGIARDMCMLTFQAILMIGEAARLYKVPSVDIWTADYGGLIYCMPRVLVAVEFIPQV